MLLITVPAKEEGELWDEKKQEFIPIKSEKERVLQLEHSLVSLSKWESKWHKAFLTKEEKTYEETIDYIKCMTLNHNVPDEVYYRLTEENVDSIKKYIEDPMTATVFPNEKKQVGPKETITSDLIYYWMVSLNIPFECQKWHINRLLTLVRVCNLKNQPPKKMSKNALAQRNHALNAARRKRLHTSG